MKEKGILKEHIDCVGANGETLIHVAAEKGHAKILRLLLDAGADRLQVARDERGKATRGNVLHKAILGAPRDGESECVEVLANYTTPEEKRELIESLDRSRLRPLIEEALGKYREQEAAQRARELELNAQMRAQQQELREVRARDLRT